MNLEDLAPARLPFPVTRSVGDAPSLKGNHIVGHFSTFGDPYEIDSHIEGRFLEQIAPGAFTNTIRKSMDGKAPMKVLFDHGQDPQMGNMILGTIESLAEDERGAAYDVAAFDGIPPLLLNGLRAGAYGSSFRFAVQSDDWDYHPEPSDANPDGIPKRTITQAQVYEFGPVTFPANPAATAGMRSTTDSFYKRSRDPEQYETLLRSAQAARTPKGAAATEPPPTIPGPSSNVTHNLEPVRSDTPPVQTIKTVENRTVNEEYQVPEERQARIAELESVIRRTAAENTGKMATAVQQQWDKDNDELDELRAVQVAYEKRMKRVMALAAEERNTEPVEAPTFIRKPTTEDIYDLSKIRSETRSRDEYDRKVTEHALRSLDSVKLGKGAGDLNPLVDLVEHRDEGEDGKGEIARRILATGSPSYRRFFTKLLKGQQSLASPEETRAAALAVTATTTTGGYAVPYVFDPTMIRIGAWTPQNPYRSVCRVETITNGNNWKAVTVTNATAVYGTEAQPSVEAGPTFGQPSYQVQTAQCFVTLSIETMEDRPDITAELTGIFAEAKDTLEEEKFSIGAGTGVLPFGVTYAAAYTAVTGATSDVTAISDTTLVEAGLPLRHRLNAVWFMSRSTLRQLLALDTGWRYFSGAGIQFPGNQNPSPVGGNAAGNTGIQLLGYPVYEAPSIVSTLTTDAAIIAALINPQSYVIVDRIGMNVEVIPQMLNGATPSFPTLQRGVLAYWRNTAKPINVDAGRTLKVA